MDPTKSTCAALTMVYKDYEFLTRWVAYYDKHIGRENIYVLSHGNDPEHRRIAEGANVVSIPRDPQMYHFDRRRWQSMAAISSGLTQFFNWVIVSDVDEFVVVDPAISDNLSDYLQKTYPDEQTAPLSIAPFGVELVHNPALEPGDIDPARPILEQRRIYRPTANYSKPCLIRVPARFTPGGHANNLGARNLSDDLYLLHLRFYDEKAVLDRLGLRKDQIANLEWLTEEQVKGHSWTNSLAQYQHWAAKEPQGEDIRREEMRAKMNEQRARNAQVYAWGFTKEENLYSIPERFSGVV